MRKWRRRTAGGIHNLTLLGESPSLLPPLLLSLSLSHTHTYFYFPSLLSPPAVICTRQMRPPTIPTPTFRHIHENLHFRAYEIAFNPLHFRPNISSHISTKIKVDLSLLFREKGPPLNCRHQFPSPPLVRYNPLCKFANWTRQAGGFSLVSENRGEINGRICYSSFSSFSSLMIPASEQRKRNH